LGFCKPGLLIASSSKFWMHAARQAAFIGDGVPHFNAALIGADASAGGKAGRQQMKMWFRAACLLLAQHLGGSDRGRCADVCGQAAERWAPRFEAKFGSGDNGQ
jgi:hypothetical protein